MIERAKPASPVIRVQKEIIWHLSCSSCGHYWTLPTMAEAETPERRSWHCPLCGTKAPARREDAQP